MIKVCCPFACCWVVELLSFISIAFIHKLLTNRESEANLSFAPFVRTPGSIVITTTDRFLIGHTKVLASRTSFHLLLGVFLVWFTFAAMLPLSGWMLHESWSSFSLYLSLLLRLSVVTRTNSNNNNNNLYLQFFLLDKIQHKTTNLWWVTADQSRFSCRAASHSRVKTMVRVLKKQSEMTHFRYCILTSDKHWRTQIHFVFYFTHYCYYYQTNSYMRRSKNMVWNRLRRGSNRPFSWWCSSFISSPSVELTNLRLPHDEVMKREQSLILLTFSHSCVTH